MARNSRSRSRSGSLDSLGRRKRRGAASSSRRGRRSRSPSRSRSRSPSRSRRRVRRSRSRSRSAGRHRRRRSRSRSRSDSPRRSPAKKLSSSKPPTRAESPPVAKPAAMDSLSHLSELEQMQLLMGFGDFDSTKGKPVQENAKGAAAGVARRETKREYRQYMNRRGGFNRPLDKA